MRAEDLFEAIGELDEQLIALSEKDGQAAHKAQHQKVSPAEARRREKRRRRATIYRFAAVAMTTAAAVFILLTARDLIGARSSRLAQNTMESAADSYNESAEEAAQDTLAAGAAQLEAEEADEAADAGPAAKYRAAQEPQQEEAAGPYEEAVEQAPAEEASQSEARKAAGDVQAETPEAETIDGASADAAAAPDKQAPPNAADPSREDIVADVEKSALDLLGENKGDYVKLEIITPEDKHNGKESTEPEYSEEREEALTSALEDGQQVPSMLVRKGEPVLYVYLTHSNGSVDTVTFYANGYVGISTIPAFVLKIPDKAFEEVMEMTR